MKVIVTGATGLVGSSLLEDCVANPAISQVFALTRKPLSSAAAKHHKVIEVLHHDFLDYPPELMNQLAGAEACLWALGGRRQQFQDVTTFRKVSVDYTVAAAQAFIAYLAYRLPAGKKFRFVYCSGKSAEWDQTKKLSFMEETRKVKGQCESKLSDLADANRNVFDFFAVQPAVILARDSGCMTKVTGKLYGGVAAGTITRGMIKLALNGHSDSLIDADRLSDILEKAA